MTVSAKKVHAYRFGPDTVAHIQEAKKTTGGNATAAVEKSIEQYSFQYRLLARFVDIAAVQKYFDMVGKLQAMATGQAKVRDWDTHLIGVLRGPYYMAVLDKDLQPEQVTQDYLVMLDKLVGNIRAFQDELTQRLESGDFDDLA